MANQEKIVGVIAIESEKNRVFFLYISQLIFKLLLSVNIIIKMYKICLNIYIIKCFIRI